MEREERFREDDSFEIDIVDMIKYIFVNIKVFIIAGVVFGLLAWGYVTVDSRLNPQYVSKVNFYLSIINSNNTAASFEHLIMSDSSVAEVISKLENSLSDQELKSYLGTYEQGGRVRISPSALRGMMQSTSDQARKTISVSAFAGNGKVSAQICRALSEVAPARVAAMFKDAELISTNKDSFTYSLVPNGLKKKVVIAALLGVALSGGAFIVLYLMKKPVQSLEHLEKRTTLPILGEVSYYSQKGMR